MRTGHSPGAPRIEGEHRGRAPLATAARWGARDPYWNTDGIKLDHEDLRLLALLAEGMPVSSVSRRMAMSDRTIRRRVRAICEQLGVKATVQAIVWAARRGLV
ncbi:MAG TPA: LuxR C-terminal-related transcriptional regulator [Micromonosporaceae bacterium]|nr:LuxR C-terminal-related transcriptional regulator [Micromonosporaceae bacterium]